MLDTRVSALWDRSPLGKINLSLPPSKQTFFFPLAILCGLRSNPSLHSAKAFPSSKEESQGHLSHPDLTSLSKFQRGWVNRDGSLFSPPPDPLRHGGWQNTTADPWCVKERSAGTYIKKMVQRSINGCWPQGIDRQVLRLVKTSALKILLVFAVFHLPVCLSYFVLLHICGLQPIACLGEFPDHLHHITPLKTESRRFCVFLCFVGRGQYALWLFKGLHTVTVRS